MVPDLFFSEELPVFAGWKSCFFQNFALPLQISKSKHNTHNDDGNRNQDWKL